MKLPVKLIFISVLWLDPALTRSQSTPIDDDKILEYNKLSREYILKKKFDSARYYNDQALSWLERYPSEIQLIDALNIKGRILSRTGNNHDAINYYQQAIEMAESKEDTAYMTIASRIYGNIGGVYYYLKNFDKALEYATKGYQISKKAGMIEAEGMFQMQMGISHMENGDYDQSLPLLLKSVDFYLNNYNPFLLQMGYVNLGKLYYQKDDLIMSEEILSKALALSDSIEALAGNAHANLLMAQIYRKKGGLNKALQYANTSLDIARTNQRGINLAHAYELLHELHRLKGDFERSLLTLEKYNRLNDSLRSSETVQKIAELEAKYESEKKEQEIKLANAEIERRERLQIFLIILIGVIVTFSSITFYFFRQRFHLRQELLSQQVDNLKLQINALIGKEQHLEVDLDFEMTNSKLKNPLTEREFEILKMVISDHSNHQIADAISVSVNTVKFHLKHIYEKLGVSNRKEALQFVIKE